MNDVCKWICHHNNNALYFYLNFVSVGSLQILRLPPISRSMRRLIGYSSTFQLVQVWANNNELLQIPVYIQKGVVFWVLPISQHSAALSMAGTSSCGYLLVRIEHQTPPLVTSQNSVGVLFPPVVNNNAICGRSDPLIPARKRVLLQKFRMCSVLVHEKCLVDSLNSLCINRSSEPECVTTLHQHHYKAWCCSWGGGVKVFFLPVKQCTSLFMSREFSLSQREQQQQQQMSKHWMVKQFKQTAE